MTAAKHNDELFAPATRPAASVGTIALFLVVIALLIGGFYLFAEAFNHGETVTSLLIFTAGLVLDTLAFWLAFGLIPGREKMEIDQKAAQ